MAKKEFTGPPLKPNGGPTTLKAWWNCSDAKTWLDVNEAMAVDPVAGQELQEALALYQVPAQVSVSKKSKKGRLVPAKIAPRQSASKKGPKKLEQSRQPTNKGPCALKAVLESRFPKGSSRLQGVHGKAWPQHLLLWIGGGCADGLRVKQSLEDLKPGDKHHFVTNKRKYSLRTLGRLFPSRKSGSGFVACEPGPLKSWLATSVLYEQRDSRAGVVG
ncbi:hypothetical protein AK812_SmicGene25129 [Symbiodinium microadriaticum]|uniref:Uncharacterized protein n=1 Tax=Symbiodinium microadriaticum TaxID=2951 RepID=A0A1Q9DD29_SYMMI|nr:hypothetical protein AK812_SmicGene25129 [Symbiodinium microadriaticum]